MRYNVITEDRQIEEAYEDLDLPNWTKEVNRTAVLSRIRQLREATSSHWLTDQELTTIKQEERS